MRVDENWRLWEDLVPTPLLLKSSPSLLQQSKHFSPKQLFADFQHMPWFGSIGEILGEAKSTVGMVFFLFFVFIFFLRVSDVCLLVSQCLNKHCSSTEGKKSKL